MIKNNLGSSGTPFTLFAGNFGPAYLVTVMFCALFPILGLGAVDGKSAEHYPREVVPGENEGLGYFYVKLSEMPAVQSYLHTRKTRSPQEAKVAARHQVKRITLEQSAVSAEIARLGFDLVASLKTIANVLIVRAPSGQVEPLRAIRGVVAIEPVPDYKLDTSVSVPFIGAPFVWDSARYNLRGDGVRIAIIDTGIDYTHADFGGSGNPEDYKNIDPTRIEAGIFPTEKVAGGWDFAGDIYNNGLPSPDPNPLDRSGHGTHVAGIAAGYGVLKDHSTYRGSYEPGMDMSSFLIGPGVAPKAKLYALKVVGPSFMGALIAPALEWCLDPNGDGDYSDRMDVVNISLGLDYDLDLKYIEAEIVENLTEMGVAVVGSAGNTTNYFYISGGYATFSPAISVANSYDPKGDMFSAIRVLSPESIAGDYKAMAGSNMFSIGSTGPRSSPLVYAEPHDACTTLTNAAEIAGSIVMMDRSDSCSFQDQITRASQAGASGVLMVNNVDDPEMIAMTGGFFFFPGFMISKATGELLKTHLAEGVTVLFSENVRLPDPSKTDTLHYWTSRGPSIRQIMKPDISGPGVNIFSAGSGAGFDGKYLSGTSMAAPHITGAVALIRQQHPGISVEDIKALVMNSALPLHDTSGNHEVESRMGSGRVNIQGIVQSTVLIKAVDEQHAVAVNYGLLYATHPETITREVQVVNLGAVDESFDLSVEEHVKRQGVTVVPGLDRITVPAGQSVTFPVAMNLDPARFDRIQDPSCWDPDKRLRFAIWEASGQINFTRTTTQKAERTAFSRNSADSIVMDDATTSLPSPLLHVPYYSIVQATNDRYSSPTLILFDADSANSAGLIELAIPQAGTAVNQSAVASLFQLAYTSPPVADPLIKKRGDLQYIGTATSAPFAGDGDSSATLYWAISTYDERFYQGEYSGYVTLHIDTNNDGKEEYSANISIGNSFMTRLAKSSTQNTPGIYGNMFPPDSDYDTAPFNTNLTVIPVPLNSLGLSTDTLSIRYWVTTTADRSPVLKFDYRRPVIRTVSEKTLTQPASVPGEADPYPERRHPAVLSQQSSIPVLLDLEQYHNHPSQNKLLVFHHLNPPGRRTEILTLKSSNANPSADLWMLK